MKTRIVRQTKISKGEYAGMYDVFSRYYENVDPVRFATDWSGKDWVILLDNDAGEVVGFSTLQTYRHVGKADCADIIYSGDTVVDRAYRNNGCLAGAFGHFLLRFAHRGDGIPAYWLLTSKGVRTYRFLPVFFKTFFPACDHPMPAPLGQLLDEIAGHKFGSAYSPETRIVAHQGQRDRVCAAEHDPRLLQREDRHIQFFLKSNPGYETGDELVCLTPMGRDNLNHRGLRVVQQTEVQWRE